MRPKNFRRVSKRLSTPLFIINTDPATPKSVRAQIFYFHASEKRFELIGGDPKIEVDTCSL
jgi:hypothetical protein